MPTIYHELTIKAPIQEVFDAITDPKHLVNWWPLICTGECLEGAVYNFYFGPNYDWFGEVVKVEPAKAFHIKMTKAEPDWIPTTFGFDLLANANGVAVQFYHKDWAEVNAHFRISSYCWALLLKGLKDYVERGIIIPFEQRS